MPISSAAPQGCWTAQPHAALLELLWKGQDSAALVGLFWMLAAYAMGVGRLWMFRGNAVPLWWTLLESAQR